MQQDSVVDPVVLEREFAANILQLMARHDAALVEIIGESSTASPLIRQLAEKISLRAAADLERARRYRTGCRPDQCLQVEEAPLRLVR